MSIRLINTESMQMEVFSALDPPPYAILSHTWVDDEELNFQEMRDIGDDKQQKAEHKAQQTAVEKAKQKAGYMKIEATCRIACQEGLNYTWVDTCCIDKSSSSELSEAINSMFKWYQGASYCLVFLSDLQETNNLERSMGSCRWFTRGWCLQELIAPKNCHFYNEKWSCIGDKSSLCSLISQITKIDVDVLGDNSILHTLPVARRMSWAAHRSTTRVEDIAYCLLGIFAVNMPLLYGEGSMAFQRLQEEILRRNNDLSIFFTSVRAERIQPYPNIRYRKVNVEFGNSDSENEHEPVDFDKETPYRDLFAHSPRGFKQGVDVKFASSSSQLTTFSLTNNGVYFPKARFCLVRTNHDHTQYTLKLQCFKKKDSIHECELVLRKIGPAQFVRLKHSFLRFKANSAYKKYLSADRHFHTEEAYIITSLKTVIPNELDISKHCELDTLRRRKLDSSHDRALRIRGKGQFQPSFLQRPVPEELWDITKQEFLTLNNREFEAHIQVFPTYSDADRRFKDVKSFGHCYLACGLLNSQTQQCPRPWVRLFLSTVWENHEQSYGKMFSLKEIPDSSGHEDRFPIRDVLLMDDLIVQANVRHVEEGGPGLQSSYYLILLAFDRESEFL